MCRRWVRAGHRVTVVTGVPNVPSGVVYDGYRNVWCTREIMDGIEVIRGRTYLAANKGFMRRIVNYLSYEAMAIWRVARLPKPDLIVATSPQFFCGWAGVWAARIKRVPLVLEIRDLWPDSILAVSPGSRGQENRAGIGGRLIIGYLRWLETRMYAAAHHIVTVGEGYREELTRRGVPAEKMSVITNGVDSGTYQPRPASTHLREQAGAKRGDDTFLVGYIGTVGLAHGLTVVIAAARHARYRGLDRLRFVVVGDGAERASLLEELARDDPGNVRFVGRRPKNEMADWLASVDACLVHLRAAELFKSVLPSKIFEACAMAKPIILGVRGHASRLLEQLGGGVCIEPERPDELVSAACRMMDQPLWAASLGMAGRREVIRRFDLDPLAARYEATLKRCLETRGSTYTRADGGRRASWPSESPPRRMR